jgi:hypothetical protein
MRAQRRTADGADHQLLAIGPELADRVELSEGPAEDTVSYFVMTWAAEQAWAAINRQLTEGSGAVCWIGGAAATGKTHFLNYVVALGQRAGGLGAEPGRRLTLTIVASAPRLAAELERAVAEVVARALGGDGASGALWRDLRGGDALRVVLDQAKRRGVRAVTVAIDLGDADPAVARPSLAGLATLATTVRNPQLTILVAGRADEAGPGIEAFTVGAAPDEVAAVAIGRARRLEDATSPAIAAAYRSLAATDYDPAQIFPFHPQAVAALIRLGDPARLIPTVARAAREALLAWRETAAPRGVIWPGELIKLPAMRTALEARLGASGCAALALARAAGSAMEGARGALAREIVELLALDQIAGDGQSLDLDVLSARLAPPPGRSRSPSGDELADAVAELAVRSRGVLLLEPPGGAVRFNPRAAGTPEVAAYNAALPLIRRFDSASQVAEADELRVALERLRVALATALERATRNRATLIRAAEETGTTLSADRERTFAEFIAIAQAGPQGLLNAAGDPGRHEACARTLAEYDVLAALVAAVPRIRAMREYLLAMGLHDLLEDDPHRDAATAKIETDCKLLLVAVNAAMQAKSPATLDALESRFQRFKWTYVPYYRAAHERWRQEMERAALLAEDGERHLAALRRLNAIPALGPPEAAALALTFGELARRVVRCQLDGPLSPEITPCCPQCNYVIGTPSPREELSDLLARVRRALEVKLAILSQSAIARLIREHDRSHRLEGFLKITQAAQTDALLRVLDDKLARYLTRLLDESLSDDTASQPATPMLRQVHSTQLPKRSAEKLPRRH